MIEYFQKSLKIFIWAKLDTQSRELNFWEEIVKKAVNIEVKLLFQPPSSIWKIDAKCFQGYRPAKKKKKDSGKNKFTDTPFADVPSVKYPQQYSIYQRQTSKKDQDRQGGSFWCRGRQKQDRSHDSPTKSANANIIKKEKKDLFYIKCYNCNKQGHYSNKYPENPKKESKN